MLADASFVFIRDKIGSLIGLLVPVLAGLALLYFIWGLVVFIAKSGDETSRTEGRRKMVWGVIALFVMISVWGLVNLIADSFQISPGDAGSPPQFSPL